MRRTEFDLAGSRAAAEEAIAMVGAHADPQFMTAALQAVHALARARPLFTTDGVWALLSGTATPTHEPRALGAVMRRAHKIGWIEPTDRYQSTVQVSAHARPKRVWRSLL